MTRMMQAILLPEFGSAEKMIVGTLPIPQPGPGEVLIKVHAAGVNRPDVLQRQGKYAPPADASPILGLEVAGEIVAGDVSNTNLMIGQSICALVPGGGYAEYCVTPAAHCLPIPSGWSVLEAATLPETMFTVWSNVWMRAGLQPTESLLVHGGGSGIGVTAIQLAVALGHTVFTTVGSADKAARCAALGAQVINYRSEDFVERIQTLTQGQGVNVVLDMVAGEYLNRDLQCLADDGRIAIIALLGGSKAQIDASQLLRRRLQVTGSTLRPRSVAYKADIAQQLKTQVWPLFAAKKIQPVIDAVFPFAQVAAAHTRMESNQHFGKIVLVM